MSGELTIRPAHSQDAAAILAYLRQIGAESDNLTFGPEGLPITEEQERQYLRQVENAPDALMLVAQEADEIVALCGLSRPRRPRMSHRAQIDASVRKSHAHAYGAVGDGRARRRNSVHAGGARG